MKTNPQIEKALLLPNGAKFYRCALQVNPFAYLKKYSKPTAFANEDDYNRAIVDACLQEGIQVIGVTDHYCIRESQSLITAARAAGLVVFPGFEAKTKEGVHFLCLFDPSVAAEWVQAKIAACGIHDETQLSPCGGYDTEALLHHCNEWKKTVCVAAHVASSDGLLMVLQKQARINAWTNELLLACSLPGSVEQAPDGLRPILQNTNADYRRDRPVAVINAQDVSDPADLKKPGASCWIKMSGVTVAGLQQAFFDPTSRIRLASDPIPDEHAEIVAVAWQGGFLDGAALQFNENLNVLIGGRGAGKSTVIESLRYALELAPVGAEAAKAHEAVVLQVLGKGTKISVLARSFRPDRRDFLIERTVPNPPVVKDADGQVLALKPSDVLPRAEAFGQHEISELARTPDKLARLLDRFMEHGQTAARGRQELGRELERTRARLEERRNEMRQIDERLAALPSLEETLKRYRDAGLESKLKEQTLFGREEKLLALCLARLDPFREVLASLRGALPIDAALVSPTALAALPNRDQLQGLAAAFDAFSREARMLTNQLEQSIQKTTSQIEGVKGQWSARRQNAQAAFEQTLRELHKAKIDGQEFLRLQRQIEDLQPLQSRKQALQREEQTLLQQRRNLLSEWEDYKTEEFQRLKRAASRVSKKLSDLVRVEVVFAGDREPLFKLLREVGGRLSETVDALGRSENLSPPALATAIRAGRDALAKDFGLPGGQADRLVQAGEPFVMQVEELDLPSITRLELNVAGEGQPHHWRTLDDLSKGQKATAVLLLLLLESDSPLLIDQPEDDLDNRFITEGIVPKMREEKRRRQFILATHNANLPVLGDAELIAALTARGEAGGGQAEIASDAIGSIDSPRVRDLVEDILEGGREAFESRRKKYGF